MRICLICYCLLAALDCLAQSSTAVAGVSVMKTDSSRTVRLISCRSVQSPDKNPLILLNGEILEEKDFNRIDANDIERIDILKNAAASTLFCGRGTNGVILITSKPWTPARFIIRDRVSGSELPGATVMLSANDHRLMAAANDSGRVITDTLKSGQEYDLKITMAGYKAFDSVIRHRSLIQTIFLERDMKECGEVILTTYPVGRTGCGRMTCFSQTISICKMDIPDSTSYNNKNEPCLTGVYPNPVQKGQTVTLELKNPQDDPLLVEIIGVSGQVLLQQQVTSNKNRLKVITDSRWPAGTYFVRVMSKDSQQAAKLIIQ